LPLQQRNDRGCARLTPRRPHSTRSGQLCPKKPPLSVAFDGRHTMLLPVIRDEMHIFGQALVRPTKSGDGRKYPYSQRLRELPDREHRGRGVLAQAT
jgi:hypothetical protein